MFIISLSIALTGLLFSQVFASSDRMLKQRAWFELNEWRGQIIINKDTENEMVKKESYVLVKESTLVDSEKKLWLINIVAKDDNDKIIMERKFFIETNGSEESIK